MSLLKQRPLYPKPKLLRSNPTRKALLLQGNDDGFLIDDEDVLVANRRQEVIKDVKVYAPDEDLPKDIEWKLFLARQLALLKYREVHGQERA